METPVIHRDLQRTFPRMARGKGVYLFDEDGKRYLDGSGGSSSVTAIGHGVEEIVEAMAQQARTLAYAPTHAFSTAAIEECARIIVEDFAPPGLERVWFVSGGSEATESAVRMALQYHRERGQATKHVIIGRWSSFHGNTIAASGFGGHTGRRRKFMPVLPHAEHIAPCYEYRCWANSACPTCDLSCANQLERVIRLVGPENVAAFIAEPVVGATLGAVPPSPGYFPAIREICDKHDVLFIADEVMTGFGRTGRNFALDHWGVVPDLIACAKGMSAGYTPLGAVIVKPEIVGEVKRRGASFMVGHTAAGNPLSGAVGAAVLRYIRDHDLVRNAADVGAYFLQQLRELKDRQPIIGDVRGLGLMLGVELVRDRTTKEPFPAESQIARQIGDATLARGLVSYPGTGSVDGLMGDHILYTPPLTITTEQIDELIAILDASLTAVTAEIMVRAEA